MPSLPRLARKNRRESERARERRRVRCEARAQRRRRLVKGLLVFACLLASVVPVLFVSHAVSYVPLATVVFFAIFDCCYLQVLKRSLVFSSDGTTSTCQRGSSAGVSVVLRNTSFLVYPRVAVTFYVSDLFGGYASELVHTVSLMPRDEMTLPMDARFRHLGRYTCGVSKVEISDLIGLLKATIEQPAEQVVNVTPKVFDPSQVALSSESVKESDKVFRPIVTDDMDYAGVREYRVGDPLKTVHWKLSGRYPDGEMFTRLFEVYGNPGLETIVDPCAPDYDTEDLMHVFDGLVESALSINIYARAAGMDAELAYIGRDGEARTTQVADVARADALVEGMARVQRASVSNDPDAAVALLRREGGSARGMGNIAFVTSRLTDVALEALCGIRARRRYPLLVLVVPRSVEGRERDEFLRPLSRLDSVQVPYYIVESTEFSTEVVGA